MPEGSGFTMDPDAVKTGAGRFGPVVDGLNAAKRELESALQAAGECWGGDESGKEFAKDYVPGAQQAVEAFGTLAQGVAGLRKNVESGAEGHDARNAEAMKNISSKGP
ncbi:WXG100 family type VII secretion target [Amycolatopsis anabasis]|uniref:WXG100 family type VII secretion target n=1 Tax=Amycolatopsis anabasis TaxID=1840409 RepID=UPI001FE28E06|nr:WXG100 family type VII secretion target [Amycolatopsis anabasis]